MSQSQVDQVVSAAYLGPLAAAVQKRVKPQQWRRIVHMAHKRGFTVNSFLDTSVPGPLKERTKASIVHQAKSTVATAYQPAQRELTLREQRVHALDAKRARDDQYYKDWLTAQHAALMTKAAAGDQALIDAQKSIVADTGAAYQRAGIDAASHVQAVTGEDVSQGAGINVDLSTAAKHSIDTMANERQHTLDVVGNSQARQGEADAQMLAYQASISAKRQADTWQSLQGVADDRQKLELARGTDAAKEISNLLGQEVQKAQNRDANDLVRQRLAIQNKTIEQRAKEAAAALGFKYKQLQTDNANTDAARAASITHNQAMEAIGRTANDIRSGNLDVAWYKAKHPHYAPGKKQATPQEHFDYGYALMTTSTIVVGKGKHAHEVPITAKTAAARRAYYIGALVAKGKLSRSMAARVFDAFIANDGVSGDPGSYHNYGPKAAANDQHGPH